MIDLYHRLSNKSTLRNYLKDYINNNHINFIDRYGLLTHNLSLSTCISDTVIQVLTKKTSILSYTIFKMIPMTAYHWHTDANRSCAVNMLIDGDASHTLIGVQESREIIKYVEIPYEQDFFYLMNTNQQHCVINGNNDRYVLSIGYDRSYTYDSIKNICIENNL